MNFNIRIFTLHVESLLYYNKFLKKLKKTCIKRNAKAGQFQSEQIQS